MRWWILVSLFWAGCKGPKLPPVPAGSSPDTVDLVPAQARAELLRGRLALEGGRPGDALAAARRAANLDQSSASPWALIAEAACALGDRGTAQKALVEALQREPDVPDLRMLRLSLAPTPEAAQLDLDWLVRHPPEMAGRPWFAVRLGNAAAEVDHSAALALAQAAARARLTTDDPAELAAIVALLEAPSAVLVGALRLHHAGLLSDSGRSAAEAAAASLSVPSVMMPQEWRVVDSVDSPSGRVGYPLSPRVAAGWQAALDGRTDEAAASLMDASRAESFDPTPRELLWLMQVPAPLPATSPPGGSPPPSMECP